MVVGLMVVGAQPATRREREPHHKRLLPGQPSHRHRLLGRMLLLRPEEHLLLEEVVHFQLQGLALVALLVLC